jgi:hypothetical protein
MIAPIRFLGPVERKPWNILGEERSFFLSVLTLGKAKQKQNLPLPINHFLHMHFFA